MNDIKNDDILAQIKSNKLIFEKFNNFKLKNLRSSINNPEIINVLEYIPLLLHVNMPEFPGYVKSDQVPSGIYGFNPSKELMSFVRSKHPSAIIPKNITPFVQMFALMGSAGTIAFSNISDFDFWVCVYEKDVDDEALKLFKLKCKEIEQWAAENYGLEVHFFINDIDKVKKNIFDKDDEYGMSGTSLGQLLKDEFFRSSIVINGKYPFWWVVPAYCSDETYELWLKSLNGSNMKSDFIDIGNLYKIIKDDFLVAALFQILKSIGNPFKSIIKLGLLERYLYNIDESPFISNYIKNNVHNNKIDSENVDAYLIMFKQVYEHYTAVINDPNSINILKTCFYLKVDPNLSSPKADDEKLEKIRVMKDIIKEWQWHDATIKHVDNFENWDIEAVNRLLTNTKKFILKGYKQILNNLQSDKIKLNIPTATLQSISHQIFSHFLPAEDKIDNTLSLKSYPPEKLLRIEFVRDKNNREFWILSKRVIHKNKSTGVILRKDKTLIGLTVWIALNGFFQKDYTRLDIDPGLYVLDPNFIRELITELSYNFTFKRLKLKNSYFFREAFPVMSYIIINPYSKYNSVIEDIVLLFYNSWGETRYKSYRSEIDLSQIFITLINSGLITELDFNNAIKLTSSQPYNSSKHFKRIKLLAQELYNFFVFNRSNEKKRYITMLGNKYFIFSNKRVRNNEVVGFYPCDTEVKLLYTIAYNRGIKNNIKIDASVPELNYLKTIIDNYKDNAIQIYFQIGNKYNYFFVSDERGSIIFYRKRSEDFINYIARLYDFSLNVIKNISEGNQQSVFAESEKRVEVYKLNRDTNHSCSITEIDIESDRDVSYVRKNIIPITLSLHLLETGDMGYRFTLPDGGYSEIYNAGEIDGIAREIKTLMDNVNGYSYYITNINLNHLDLNMYKNFTSLAFSEKNRFELLVEKGMKII